MKVRSRLGTRPDSVEMAGVYFLALNAGRMILSVSSQSSGDSPHTTSCC